MSERMKYSPRFEGKSDDEKPLWARYRDRHVGQYEIDKEILSSEPVGDPVEFVSALIVVLDSDRPFSHIKNVIRSMNDEGLTVHEKWKTYFLSIRKDDLKYQEEMKNVLKEDV